MRNNICKKIIASILSATLIATIAVSGAFASSIQVEAAETNMVMALRSAFDANNYANIYPDVKAALGTDANVLFNHFMKFGMKEGRMLNSNFDPKAYCEAYPDIKAICPADDYTKAYEHYINYGKNEGRTLTTYVAINKKKAAEAPKLQKAKVTTYQVYLGHNLTVNINESMYNSSSFRILRDIHGFAAYYGDDLYATSDGYNGEGAYHYSTIRINDGDISETIHSYTPPQQQTQVQPQSQPAAEPEQTNVPDTDDELTDEEAEALTYLLLLASLQEALEKGEITQEEYNAAVAELLSE